MSRRSWLTALSEGKRSSCGGQVSPPRQNRRGLPSAMASRLLPQKAGAAEHGKAAADEQEKGGQHRWPATLQPGAALLEPWGGALAGDDKGRDDRQQWQYEAGAVEGE